MVPPGSSPFPTKQAQKLVELLGMLCVLPGSSASTCSPTIQSVREGQFVVVLTLLILVIRQVQTEGQSMLSFEVVLFIIGVPSSAVTAASESDPSQPFVYPVVDTQPLEDRLQGPIHPWWEPLFGVPKAQPDDETHKEGEQREPDPWRDTVW